VHLVRDAVGRLVHLDHLEVFDLARDGGKPQALADAYVQANQGLFHIEDILDFGPRPKEFSRDAGTKLRPDVVKQEGPALVFGYTQYLNNVPVWGGGLAVLMIPSRAQTHRVVGASSDVHFDVTSSPDGNPVLIPQLTDDGAAPTGDSMPGYISVADLQELLSSDPTYATLKINKILERSTIYYYRYDAARRFVPPVGDQGLVLVRRKPKGSTRDLSAESRATTSAQPPLQQDLHYLATELRFMAVAGEGAEQSVEIEYQAFISVGTGQLLAVHALAAACLCAAFPVVSTAGPQAQVLTVDPLTKVGRGADLPPAPISAAALDSFAEPVTLDQLAAVPGTELNDALASIMEIDAPVSQPAAAGAGGVFADTPSGDAAAFSAITVYYHVASLFRMLRQLNILTKYSDIDLPLWIDQLDGFRPMRAITLGHIRGRLSDELLFGAIQPNSDLSAALDVRLVLHEFSHVLLQRAHEDLNLAFAHSFGDSLAAILTDPCSKLRKDPETGSLDAPDRFSTFPWFEYEHTDEDSQRLYRSHGGDRRSPRADRGPAQPSYAWSGPVADAEAARPDAVNGYDREQILSTSLFRAYRAIGGDSETEAQRLFAARYMAYLIIQAAWLLPTVDHHAGGTVEDFVLKIRTADVADRYVAGPDAPNPLFGDLPGGAVHKVVQWAFEEQGLYVPPTEMLPDLGRGPTGTGVDSGKGQLPDLYIGADRAGYLPYREGIFNTTDDLWNVTPDGQPGTPVADEVNSIFVRVHNRGVDTVSDAQVTVYWRADAESTHWDPAPASGWVQADSPPPPVPAVAGTSADAQFRAGDAVFGPFSWTPPSSAQGWVLLASVSSPGDPSNLAADFPCALNAIPLARLLPYDNNLALRRYPSP
jgi:hypothetical protein